MPKTAGGPTTGRYRPGREYLVDAGSVVVPGSVAAWLEQHTNLDQQRMRLRGQDRTVDEALLALHHVAVASRVSPGSASELGLHRRA